MIVVGYGYKFGCEDYESYLDTKEYGEEFYALVGKKGKPIGREKRKGKKIGYNGRVFFAQEKMCAGDRFYVTDAKTGLLVQFYQVKNKWDKFIESANKQANIESFPVVVKGDDGEYHEVKGGESDG